MCRDVQYTTQYCIPQCYVLELKYICEMSVLVMVDVCVFLTAGSSECLSPVSPAPVPVSESCEDPGLSGSVPEAHLRVSVPLCEEDNDLMGDELDSLLDSVAGEHDAPRVRNIKQEFLKSLIFL